VGVTDAPGLEVRERRLDVAIARWGPYIGLAVGAATTPFFVTGPALRFWMTTGSLVLVTVVWTFAFTWRDRPPAAWRRAGAVYIAGLLVLGFLLVRQSPFFGFYVFVGYYHSFEYLRGRWRWAGLGATAVIAGYAQIGGGLVEPTPGILVAVAGLAAVNGLLAGGFTYYGALTADLSARRRQENVDLAEANRRLTETLDENAGLHTQLLARAREAGIADERARLAREIHDTIAQGLTAVVTQLEAAGSADGDPQARRGHIDSASALARESLAEARRSVAALAPGRLAEAHLPDAIAGMASKWAEQAEVEVVVDTTGDPRPLLPEIEVTLFRVAQESLANVAKHAGARRAGLTLSYMDDVVVLDVRDDGRGFARGEQAGFGLAGMEQRVRRVSGTLSIESEPGDGTAISASVPAIPAGEEGAG
jgi:signal transduction histidine kinase